MDLQHVQDACQQAGYTCDWATIAEACTRHPEAVLDWITAVYAYAEADTGWRLLTASAAALRERITASTTDDMGQHADAAAEVCDLLTRTTQARTDALTQLTQCCATLTALEPPALQRAAAATADGGGVATLPEQPTDRLPPPRAVACHGAGQRRNRRPRRPQPPPTA